MRWYSDPKIVSKTGVLTVLLLESANIGQVWRMWTERTAAGQSLGSWISVGLALWLWCHFFRVCAPTERFAYWSTLLGITMNLLVILTVIYWRYLNTL